MAWAQQIVLRLLPALALAGSLSFSVHAQQASDLVDPEQASGSQTVKVVTASRQMVVAASPSAAEAGLEALRAGGTAADAVVVVQTVLGLVEPQSSGLGGGAFLVWYDAGTKKITTFDARETAPAEATPDLFRSPDGKPLSFFEAVVGGRSVGVPGVPMLLETVHRRHGNRPWASLFNPAIKPCRAGLCGVAAFGFLDCRGQGPARRRALDPSLFLRFGRRASHCGPPPRQSRLRRNSDALWPQAVPMHSTAARSLPASWRRCARIQRTPACSRWMTSTAYRVKERAPVCTPYRGYDVCGMGPPSSGAIAIGQILGLLQQFDLRTLGPDDPESWRLIGDATRLAFADRERYLADSDFVSIPKGLLDAAYLQSRATLLRRPTALGETEARGRRARMGQGRTQDRRPLDGNSIDLAFRHRRCRG